MSELVSVIIPVYNCEKYITDAVDSVLAQTHRSIEIIVVDDGSTDKTKEALAAYGDRIKYIYKENGGPASARNVGIKMSKGQFIAFLDADDMWVENKLEQQLIDIDDAGMVGSGVKPGLPHPVFLSYKELLLKNSFINSSVLVKRECFDRVGCFDERPQFKAVEDWDMWLRISKEYKVKLIGQRNVIIRKTSSSISGPWQAAKMLENEKALLDKHFKENKIRANLLFRGKVYSRRYRSAAIAYSEVGKRIEVFSNLLKTVALYPFSIFEKQTFSLFLYLFIGCKNTENQS